jgi:tetratricopeptide (TPR) repeat protein
VLARRGTLFYRAGRFVRRRRGLVAQGVLLLLLASAATLWLVEREMARRAFRLDRSPGASPWLALPVRSSAEESYRRGLAARARGESVEAARRMREAVEASPRNPLIRAALADVLALGDRMAEAKAVGERALALAPPGESPRESRLLVESVALRTAGRRADEAKVLRSLWLLRPENLEIGLLFGRSLARAGETEEAQEVVRRLRALPRPERDDPRIALLALSIFGNMGKMQELLAEVPPVKEEARRRGLPLILGVALLHESDAHDGLGDSPRTRALALEAKEIFRRHGELGGVARADHMLCLASLRENRHEQVERECGDSVRLHRRLGNPGGVSKALNLLGASRRRRGLLAEARNTFQEALAEGRGLGDRLHESRLLYNVANVDLELGRLLDAESGFRQVIPIKREIGDRRGLLMALKTQAQILMKRGVLREVEPILAEAESVGRELGGSRELADLLWTRGDLTALQGDLKKAFAAWEEAERLYEKAGEADSVAEMRFIRIEHTEPHDAAVCRALEGVARELEAAGDEDVVSASLSASRCWNEVGSQRQAGPLIERAAKHPILERSAPGRIDLAMTRGIDAMARRQWGEAERWLGEAAGESRKLSYGALLLESRLLQLQLARARGDHPERVRTLAEELSRDAEVAGFARPLRK